MLVPSYQAFPNLGISSQNSSFFTTFATTENPISEAGRWIRQSQTGVNFWHDVLTTGGNAVASSNAGAGGSDFDDSYAYLTGSWPGTLQAEGTIYVGAGVTSGEIELNFRCADSSATARLYELTLNIDTHVAFARWNGAPDDFTILIDGNSGLTVPPSQMQDGDRYRGQISGQTLTTWYSRAATPTTWVLIGSFTDNSAGKFTDGAPGIGFFNRTPGSIDYGFKDYSVIAL